MNFNSSERHPYHKSKMRSYRPRSKSPQYMYIPNVVDRCRLCLTYSNTLIPIFEESNTLVPRIFTCVSVLLNQNENLPESICNDCLSELNKYYEFKKKCQINDCKLKKHLNLIQLEKKSCSHTKKDKIQVNILKENERIEIYNDKVNSENNESKTTASCKIESHLSKLVSAALGWNNKKRNSQGIKTNVPLQPGGSSGCVELGNFKTVQVHTKDGAIVTLQLEESASLSSNCEESKTILELPSEVTIQKENGSYFPNTLKDFQHNSDKAVHQSHTGAACNVCNRWFDNADCLTRHATTHTAERPFKCDQCGGTFKNRSVLTRHLLTHLEKRPYECGVCNKSYTQESSLRSHLQSHQPASNRALRLTACPMCGKTFCHRSGLTRHMKSHTAEVFACSVCRHLFRDPSALRRHRLNMHAGNASTSDSNKDAGLTY